MSVPGGRRETIAFYGHFNATNFGNEATFQAILHHLRREAPGAKFICISSGPFPEPSEKDLSYIPVSESFDRHRLPRNPLARALYKFCRIVTSEAYRWIKGVMTLRSADALIVPGGGLLTDAFGLRGCGPYNVFKWSLIAKLSRCKLMFVSVGAGPFYGALGSMLVWSALSLADFRSYRDDETKDLLKAIGVQSDGDRVYPDLAFSLYDCAMTARNSAEPGERHVVGVGLMSDSGRYSGAHSSASTYQAYRQSLAQFVKWLIAEDYDVRLIIGDMLDDQNVTRDFRRMLAKEIAPEDMGRVVEEPAITVSDLLRQIAATDFVVATRFHNVIFAMLCGKPVISLSFHEKCDALMRAAGLTEYCLRFDVLTPRRLVDRFCDMVRNEEILRSQIRGTTREFRKALDEQYTVIFRSIRRGVNS